MNQKISLVLLFLLTALLAASITLNVMQASGAQDPNYQKAKSNAISAIMDIRKTGTLVENNVIEGSMIISYDSGTGPQAMAKVWLTPTATMTRVRTTVADGDAITSIGVAPIEQKDFRVGETVFVQFTNSPEHNRLEANNVIAGDLLPLSK